MIRLNIIKSNIKHHIFGDEKYENFTNEIDRHCATQVDDNQKSDYVNNGKISVWQAGWNVTSAIQGMFLVSFPYALAQGGYWTLLAITVIAAVCIYTSWILVECLYEEDADGQRVRVRNSYVDIAKSVWGPKVGLGLLLAAQIIELSMTCILYILVSGELLFGCFGSPSVSLATCITISTLLLLPCAFLQSIQRVSSSSFWCTIAHLIINVTMIIYCLTKVSKWHWDQMSVDINILGITLSLGIVVFSYTSQVFAPSLEGKMGDPKRFTCMLVCTHIAAAVLKSTFAYVCFLTWGKETMEVITNNSIGIQNHHGPVTGD